MASGGWQAKYFTTSPGDTQWREIDESVETALDKHPKLVRYFVCLPRDLADARFPGRKSARQKWDDRVVDKWAKLAATRRMQVEFILWGETQLTEMLTQPGNAGRLRFFFHQQAFVVVTQSWRICGV